MEEQTYPTAADYYKYLEDNLLLETQLASTETISLYLNGSYTEDYLEAEEIEGVASVVVEDFDDDNSLEMLVVKIQNVPSAYNFYSDILYAPDETVPINPDNRCLELWGIMYDADNGEIKEKSSDSLGILPTDGWGKLLLGLEKVNDQYYVFTYNVTENMSSYGANHFIVANSSMGKCYVGPVFGYDTDIINDRLNISNPLDIDQTTLYDVMNSLNSVKWDPRESYEDALGKRLICFIDSQSIDWGEELAFQMIDYTNLREYLENDAENWEKIDFPQGGK